jgi:hypothetical protein
MLVTLLIVANVTFVRPVAFMNALFPIAVTDVGMVIAPTHDELEVMVVPVMVNVPPPLQLSALAVPVKPSPAPSTMPSRSRARRDLALTIRI